NSVTSKNAKSGTITVIEVKTGRILAIAKYPSFDPNNFSLSSEDERRFFAITDSFEPGSVMKAFSASAWIENTKNIKQRFNCTGAVKIGDTTINCTGTHGNLGIEEAIRYSCNSFISQSVGTIEGKKIYEIMNRFGFGKVTASGISGESSGILRPLNEWSGLSKYSISIGQEISVTILQLASAYSAIANNGVYLSPRIIDRIEDNEGNTIRSFENNDSKRILSEANALKMKEMLKDVIEKGTGRKAKLKYFTAGGKTGTAQKFIQKSYVKNVNFSVFAGFAPVENSDICITVVIDEPKGITSASEIAAPIFSEIADDILLYRKNNVKKINQDKIKKTSVKSFFNYDKLPDFSGKTESETLDILSDIQKNYDIQYTLKGKGKSFSQNPPPGSSLDHGLIINIEFR
ncbi:MAG TPA: penicillin-binding transpeptidase domain-containing protein, partial [Spirochaetota bacterium]|nr:penicillin-binding transpeptidase domain-containing protein [Spirochaetota bacterium]